MPDQRQIDLRAEVQRFLKVNGILMKPKGAAWDHLSTLFEDLRLVYPSRVKGTWGTVETPPSLEEWVKQINAGESPRPNDEDLRRMQQAEQKKPGSDEAAFYRRWYRLVDYSDDVLRANGLLPAAGVGASEAAPRGSGGGGQAQSVASSQAASAQYSGDGQRRPTAAAPQQAQLAQAARNTGEIPAIQPLLEPVSHRAKFDDLHGVADTMVAQRKTLNEVMTHLNTWLNQFWSDSERLERAASLLLVGSDWVTREDYLNLRQRHDALDAQNRRLRDDNQALTQAAQEREQARVRTANLLVKEAQGLWKQFNLRSEGEKRLSEHDRNLAMQVYNDMLSILDAACGVRAMDVKEGDRFDGRNMVDIAAPIKAKDKHLRGCVAWVEEPGFYDATGIWQARVAVYGDD